MGQIVGPWESQEGRSLYLPHPQLRIAHPDHGKSFTKSSLRSHIFAPSPVLYSYGSRRTTWLLIRQSNPLYLDGIVSIFFVLLFFSLLSLSIFCLLSRDIHTHTCRLMLSYDKFRSFYFPCFFLAVSQIWLCQPIFTVGSTYVTYYMPNYVFLLSKHATLLHRTLRTIIVQILSFSSLSV